MIHVACKLCVAFTGAEVRNVTVVHVLRAGENITCSYEETARPSLPVDAEPIVHVPRTAG
eukprot:m.244093 g.244093  ORF g.244093 m.244093 type:complete len:60 (-) comp19467_c0_seq3:412-591(-)